MNRKLKGQNNTNRIFKWSKTCVQNFKKVTREQKLEKVENTPREFTKRQKTGKEFSKSQKYENRSLKRLKTYELNFQISETQAEVSKIKKHVSRSMKSLKHTHRTFKKSETCGQNFQKVRKR